jgi:ATP-dependent DNA helicase RecG
MAQLDYMEKRGSGLTRICNETKTLEGYRDELKPVFKSTPTQFQTTLFASTDMINVGNNVGNNVGDDVGDQADGKLTERQRDILNLIKESPTISGRQMSGTLSVSQRTIERDLSYLQNNGILKHEGKDNDGAWVIVKNVNPKVENPIAKQIDDCQINKNL